MSGSASCPILVIYLAADQICTGLRSSSFSPTGARPFASTTPKRWQFAPRPCTTFLSWKYGSSKSPGLHLGHQVDRSAFDAPGLALISTMQHSEWIMHNFALLSAFTYTKINKVPRIVMLLAMGGLTSFLVNFMHRHDKKQPQPQPQPGRPVVRQPAVLTEPTAAPGVPKPALPLKQSTAKKRKSGK